MNDLKTALYLHDGADKHLSEYRKVAPVVPQFNLLGLSSARHMRDAGVLSHGVRDFKLISAYILYVSMNSVSFK